MSESFLEVEGIRIRYRKANEESPRKVVLLHGMAFNADTWYKLGTINKLSEAGYAVYAIDMPGFGKSSGRRMSRWMAAEFLRKVLDELDINQSALVGPSMGGGIALSFAILYQSRLIALILISPAGLRDKRITRELDKIRVPVLVFWGENDRVFPINMAQYLMNRIRGSELIICPNARHPCYLDAPDLFHKELIKFLGKVFKLK